MGKGGNLKKLKSALKKLPSFNKLENRTTTNSIVSDAGESSNSSNLQYPVYVGRCGRRYLVSSQVIDHPLFQVLVSNSNVGSDHGVSVTCEVVLFQHLVWMLENSDDVSHLESMDELVDFYTY